MVKGYCGSIFVRTNGLDLLMYKIIVISLEDQRAGVLVTYCSWLVRRLYIMCILLVSCKHRTAVLGFILENCDFSEI